MTATSPIAYLTLDRVLADWPVLTRAELRRAVKANPPLIGYYDFRGGPFFTAAQVQDYIDRIHLRAPQCPAIPSSPSDSRSETISSSNPIPTTAASITPAGMTPGTAQLVGDLLAQRMKGRRGSPSPRSSRRQPRDPQGKPRLELVKSSS